MHAGSHKPLKIAVVVGRFPCTSETFVVSHVRSLLEEGHDVDICSLREPRPGEIVHHDLVTHDMLGRTTYFQSLAKDYRKALLQVLHALLTCLCVHARSIYRLWTLGRQGVLERGRMLVRLRPLLRKRYDVIHCHFGSHALRVMAIKDLTPRALLCVTFHGYDIRLGLERGEDMYRGLFERADRVISICDYNKERLLRMGCPEEKLVDIPNGVDTDTFAFTERPRSEPCVITTVARLVEVKNIPMALKVMQRIKDENKIAAHLTIIGDGPLRGQLQERIDRDGLREYVELRGYQEHNEVRAQLARSHIFLLTSDAEALPVVLLEAQSVGVPVVSTNVGGVGAAVVDGHTGYLVRRNDSAGATQAIYRLFGDSDSLRTMGQNGRRVVEAEFSAREQTRKLVREYERAMTRHPFRPNAR